MTGPVRRAIRRRAYVRRYARDLADHKAEVRALTRYVVHLRDNVLHARLDRALAELQHAVMFITARGLRGEYEAEAAARRRAHVARARGHR